MHHLCKIRSPKGSWKERDNQLSVAFCYHVASTKAKHNNASSMHMKQKACARIMLNQVHFMAYGFRSVCTHVYTCLEFCIGCCTAWLTCEILLILCISVMLRSIPHSTPTGMQPVFQQNPPQQHLQGIQHKIAHVGCLNRHWAARYNTWLLIKLTPKGIVFSFLFFSFLFFSLLFFSFLLFSFLLFSFLLFSFLFFSFLFFSFLFFSFLFFSFLFFSFLNRRTQLMQSYESLLPSCTCLHVLQRSCIQISVQGLMKP